MAVETRLLAKRFAVRRVASTVETILQSCSQDPMILAVSEAECARHRQARPIR
jgi:hypothetical protein